MLINGLRYKIKEVVRRDFELTNKGCIEAHLKGNFSYPWKRSATEWYVKARRCDEDWDRVLVFTDSEFKKLFPLNTA